MKVLRLILACLFLTSCTFPSKKMTPPIAIPKNWAIRTQLPITHYLDLPSLKWWEMYEDQTLNALIKKAIQKNNDIRLAITNIQQAQSQLDEIRLNWLPTMPLLAGFSQMPILANPGAFYIAAPLYVINIFQQYQTQQQAEFLLQASQQAKHATQLMVISEVAASYFILLSQIKALELQKQLLKYQKQDLNLVKKTYRSGVDAIDEMALSEVKIQTIQSQIAIIKHNIHISQNTLHYLLDENPGSFSINHTFDQIRSNRIIPGNFPAEVLIHRPDVQQAELNFKAAEKLVRATTSQLLPTINLGNYLGQGKNLGGIALTEAYLSIPVIDFPLLAQMKGSYASYQAAYITYRKVIRQALREVTNDLSAFNAYSQQLVNYGNAYKQLNRHCHWSSVRYQHGIDSSLDVVRCRIKLTELNLLVNQNKLEKMLMIVKLYQDLAGGYAAIESK